MNSSGIAETAVQALAARERQRFLEQHPQSVALAGRARHALFGGVPMHWMSDWSTPVPLFVERAEGARFVDVDGHEYVDFCLGDTGSMFGHSPAPIAAALREQAGRGLTTMLPGEDAVVCGERLAERFGLPFWQVTTTATDANRFVLRWARAITGRKVILVFDGCYHGTVDEAMVRARDGHTVHRPGLIGQARNLTQHSRVVPFNDLAALEAALRPDTILVSVLFVNNEIGVIQDIPAIGEMLRSRGILLHVDSAQATGKIDIDLDKLKVDLMSFSAHKTYGPKGIGALYIRRKPRVRLEAQMHGGGHERGFRSGTLATHQIAGMGEAYRIAREDMHAENERIRMLRDRLWAGLQGIEETYLNGDIDARVPHNLNVSFNFVEGESLIMAIKDLAVSSGSACTSASLEPSYVLRALGRNDELAHSSIRFSIGRFTTEADVDYAIKLLQEKIGKLREMSPLWEMFKDGVDLNSIEWAAH